MDLPSVRDAIERYARAVQEADTDKLRSITSGVLREQLRPGCQTAALTPCTLSAFETDAELFSDLGFQP